MRLVNIMKRVLQILGLVNFDLDVDEFVNSCVKVTDFIGHTRIVVIALGKIVFVVQLLVWTWGRQQEAFPKKHTSLLEFSTPSREQRKHFKAWMSALPLCETCMGAHRNSSSS